MIKVMICDDHAIVREGLKQIISKSNNLEVTGEASCGEEVLQKIRSTTYDVVVLDVGMSGIGGIETLKQLKAIKPELPVLILSMYPEERYAIRTLKAGASGYLTKHSAPHELENAIHTIASGNKYITGPVAEKLVTSLNADGQVSPHEKLSDREDQVLLMLAGGKSLTEIAEHMCLSIKTISTYKARIFDKLKITSNAELVRYAIEHDLK